MIKSIFEDLLGRILIDLQNLRVFHSNVENFKLTRDVLRCLKIWSNNHNCLALSLLKGSCCLSVEFEKMLLTKDDKGISVKMVGCRWITRQPLGVGIKRCTPQLPF